MKKTTALLFIFILVFVATSCRKIESAEVTNVSISTTETSLTGTSQGNDNVIEGANRPESWAAAYPFMADALSEFYIASDGNVNYYFYRNSEDLRYWVNTEFNIDGWYYYNGRIISADGKTAIEENYEPLSPFVTYKAEAYSGPLPSAEETEKATGTVFALNSCTPYALSGIRLDGDVNTQENRNSLSLTDVRTSFSLDENIMFYLDGENALDGLENKLSNKLMIYCVPSRDAEQYKNMTSDEMSAICAFENSYTDAAQLGSFNFSNSVKAGNDKGCGSGLYDIVFMYENTAAYYITIEIL